MKQTLIQGGMIHTMDEENRIFLGDVLVENGSV